MEQIWLILNTYDATTRQWCTDILRHFAKTLLNICIDCWLKSQILPCVHVVKAKIRLILTREKGVPLHELVWSVNEQEFAENEFYRETKLYKILQPFLGNK